MKPPVKNWLVYADGRVVAASMRLEGRYFTVSERVRGDMWKREFEVHLARLVDPNDPEKLAVCTMVGVERSFTLLETAEEGAKRTAEFNARTMDAALWGIRHYSKEPR